METDAAEAEGKEKVLSIPSEPQATLYRIIGNEIPGRHQKGQTLKNLQYMLDQEPELEGCHKRFLLNRIVNQTLERQVMELLQRRGVPFRRIAFLAKEYKKIPYDTGCLPHPKYLLGDEFQRLKESRQARLMFSIYRLKNIYVFNNNGARNDALREGKQSGTWTLPWDGNCFLEEQGWKLMLEGMRSGGKHYLTVPMRRLKELPHNSPANEDCPLDEEPQIAFHRSSNFTFDEQFYYGHLSKVELLRRLGASGTWTTLREDMGFGLRCPKSNSIARTGQADRRATTAGWVSRLPSGIGALESGPKTPSARNKARVQGSIDFLFSLDLELQQQQTNDMIFYNLGVLEAERTLYRQAQNSQLQATVDRLIARAERILARRADVQGEETNPGSEGSGQCVGSITSNSASQHSDEGQASSLRNREAWIYTHHSGCYSSVSSRAIFLQAVSDVTISALASFFSGNDAFATHALKHLYCTFLDERTRLLPDLRFATPSSTETHLGVRDIVGLHHLLDAARLMERSGLFQLPHVDRFKVWLHDLQGWLTGTVQGKNGLQAPGYRGVFYDLVVASIAAYLDERFTLIKALARAQSRISTHFSQQAMPQQHAVLLDVEDIVFECEGWVSLAYLSSRFGNPLWCYADLYGSSVAAGVGTLLEKARTLSSGSETPLLESRILELGFLLDHHTCTSIGQRTSIEKYAFQSADVDKSALRPYWSLGLKASV
eukprot:scaffold770_cov362-Pavlova_lutheri.AAC.2